LSHEIINLAGAIGAAIVVAVGLWLQRRARARDGLICVDVQDNGVGIRAVDQPMICTPFFRGERTASQFRREGLEKNQVTFGSFELCQ